jgi:hypothetical protein
LKEGNIMNQFFKELEKGVKGVLQGKILSFRTIRKDDRVYTKATIGIAGLYLNFDTNIPEQFVPDCVEGAEIHLLPKLRIGQWNKPEIAFDVDSILPKEPEF